LRRLKFGQERGSKEILEKNTAKKSEVLRLVREKIPLLLLTTGLSIVTFIVQKSGGVLKSMETISLSARLTNAMVSYLEYLEKTVWPKGLAVFYPHPGNAMALWKGILCGMVLVGITAIAIKFIKKAPYFAVGWFWYLGTLVPVIQIVQTGEHAMADRYAYVPLIGIFIIVAWGLPELMAKWRHRDKVLTILAGVWIPILMTMTWAQIGHWKNSITIFEHAISVTDNKYSIYTPAHNNLGNALFAKGKTEEAISHYKTAIKIKPDNAKAYSNLGIALVAERKIEEAISYYKMAIKLKPDFAKAYSNLGIILSAERKIEEAISHYKMAIKLKPDYALAHYNLGNTLRKEGRTSEAISHYKMASKLKPTYAGAHNNLGFALVAEGKNKEAISHYKMAIKLKPTYAKAHNNLGNALLNKGRTSEAISHYKMAIKLSPNYAGAHNNLGFALVAEGKNKEAISHYKMAIKLKPTYAKAHNNLEKAKKNIVLIEAKE